MKTLTISTRTDGHKAIDAIGDNEATIKRLQAENKKLRALVEEWARNSPEEAFAGGGRAQADTTGRYDYRLAKADPALRVQSHLTEEDVVAKLGGDIEMAQYVKKTYDTAAIKADFGGSAAKRRQVEAFGLYFTRPEPHLRVEEK